MKRRLSSRPDRSRLARLIALVLLLLLLALVTPTSPADAAPAGQVTWGVHVTLAPTWFDPAETPGIVTPFMILYALHDALVKPMPGNRMTPSLAESWSVSKDGLVYEFVLRKNVHFHDGSTLTAEDVKFSFERYRGAGARALKEHVAAVEIVDPLHVRFRLRRPWPDFMTFYATPATGAAWIVPKKYVEKVGDDGFKKAPIGAGPYRFVSFKPGIELRLEAFEGFWRKTPAVKTLVLRSIPDESTRLAALKRGEVDIAYSITGPLAEELRRTPGLTLKASRLAFTTWLTLNDQWDAKSPWHDQRVRVAANVAIDRTGISQAVYAGLAQPAVSFIPQAMDLVWKPPVYPHDPARARRLLAEAGYPNGFDAGDMAAEAVYGTAIGEPVVNYFEAVGIRMRLRLLERAAFYKEWGEKRLRNVVFSGSAAFGNAATRLEAYAVAGGQYVIGSYPEVDGLFAEQGAETNPRVRGAILDKVQQIIHEHAMFVPLVEPVLLNGVGPRVAVSAVNNVPLQPYSAPYEDITLKTK